MRQFRSPRGDFTRVQQFALEDLVEVIRGEAYPLRPISIPMHLAVKQLSPLANGGSCEPMPTPRASWLVEPHSVDTDLSRSSSHSQAPL